MGNSNYSVGYKVMLYWDPNGPCIQSSGAMGEGKVSGPSVWTFSMSQSELQHGSTWLETAYDTDIGSWTVTLTVTAPPSCVAEGTASFNIVTGPPAQPIYLNGQGLWPNRSIPIYIQATNFADAPSTPVPSYAKQAVLNAMTIWNLAQEWFKQTYMSNVGSTYELYQVATTPSYGITVTFNQTGSYAGITDCDVSRTGRRVTGISCMINLNVGRHTLQSTPVHEFGHALGLKHSTPVYDDLMYGNHGSEPYTPRPTTLNLYAVHLLAQAGGDLGRIPAFPVVLPASIPYVAVPENSVPEFPSVAIILLFAVASTCYAIERRKSYSR